MLAKQRRMAAVCILKIKDAIVYYEVFLIRGVCEVKCTLKDLPFRAIVVSYRIHKSAVVKAREASTAGVAGGRRAGQIPRAYLIAAQHIGNTIVLV